MAENDDPIFAGTARAPDEVAIDYIKAPDFRIVWADGAMGSPTPSGHIHFVLFAERPAIPRRQVHKLDLVTGVLGEAIPEKTISRGALVREMSCDVMIAPETALTLAQWLVEQVKILKGEKK
jgi:hypothetical protein